MGQPVSRGHGGNRLFILQGGLALGDLSRLSADHALGLETLSLVRVEVVRSVETLRYGSGLTGGFILTEGGLFPIPQSTSSFSGGYRYRSVSSEHRLIFRGALSETPWWLALTGGRWHYGDLTTGRGRLDHSHGEGESGGVGMGYFEDSGWLGISFRHLHKRYALPDSHSATLDLKQDRFQLRARLAEALTFDLGWTPYRHHELEDGEVVGRWRRKTIAGRIEWRSGIFGFSLQGRRSQIEVSAEEAQLPPTELRELALFLSADWPERTRFLFRVEHVSSQSPDLSTRRDLLLSGGFKTVFPFSPNHRFGLDFLTTARAPGLEERSFYGVHHALQSFTSGSPDLRPERSHLLELSYHFKSHSFQGDFTLFHHRFEDYIFWRRLGVREGLPYFQATQTAARFRGFEASLAYFRERFTLTLFGDYTRGQLAGGGDVPRMPPLRYGFELELFPTSQSSLTLRCLRAEPQNHPGEGEAPTPGYIRLDLRGTWMISLGGTELLLFGAAENLFDQTVRQATTFRRLPEGGLGFQIGFQLTL